jgi:L-asparaginase/Glu-tRNA(Gln) amidotransferase subunit D
MSELPSCERNSFKSFINIWRAYGLGHQRSSIIERVESCRSKTQVVLTNQQEQGRHLKITKKRSTKERSTKSKD